MGWLIAHLPHGRWLTVTYVKGSGWPNFRMHLVGRRRHHWELGVVLLGSGWVLVVHDWKDFRAAMRQLVRR